MLLFKIVSFGGGVRMYIIEGEEVYVRFYAVSVLKVPFFLSVHFSPTQLFVQKNVSRKT